MTVRLLPAAEPRVETGPVQFGDDWPGTFIRGDNAAAYAMALRVVLNTCEPDIYSRHVMAGLLSDLEASRVWPQ